MTLAIFKESGKTPVLKDKLNISARCSDISFWVSLSFLNGILLGPVDLLLFREEIIASVLALNVEVEWIIVLRRKILENLIFDWIAGATKWKKSLNIFAVVVDSVMHFPLLRIDQGVSLFLLFIDLKVL